MEHNVFDRNGEPDVMIGLCRVKALANLGAIKVQ
jgi:hypothetical protein